MRTERLASASAPVLVRIFRDICLAQDAAEIEGATARYNRLFFDRMRLKKELQSREGDQRRLLVKLYDDINLRVRLYAALATLAVVPTEAREVLQQLRDWRVPPYSGEAASILNKLDDGSFVPR